MADWGILEGRWLAFLGKRAVVFEKEGCNVFIHSEVAGACSIVPGEVDARVEIVLPVLGDVVVLLEDAV